MGRHRPSTPRATRLHHGLTLREVAAVSGYSIAWISYVERGLRRDPDGVLPETLRRLTGETTARKNGGLR